MESSLVRRLPSNSASAKADRYNRLWQPLDWRNIRRGGRGQHSASSQQAYRAHIDFARCALESGSKAAYRVGTACWGCPPRRTREAPLLQSHHFLKSIFDVANRLNDQSKFIIVLYKAVFFAYAHDFVE